MQLASLRRMLSIILSTVLICLTLVSMSTVAAETPQKVTITFLNGWNADRIPLMAEVIRRFEARYPWITVNSQVVDPTQLAQKLTVAVIGNAAPDLTMVTFNDSIRFGKEGALSPLEPFVQKDGLNLSSYLYPPVLHQLTNNPIAGRGNYYYLPQLIGTPSFLFYNISHFHDSGLSLNDVPETWSKLEQVARRLNRPTADGFSRLGIDLGINRVGTYQQWLQTAGGRFYSDDLRKVVLDQPSSHGLLTLEWIIDFTNRVNKGLVVQEKLNVSGRTGFYNKQFSMLIDGAFSNFQIKSNAPDIDFGMAELPYRDGYGSHPSMGLGWGYAIPANAPHPQEAWLFMKFLTLEIDGGGYFLLQQGRPGATFQINNQRGFVETNPYWPVIQQVLNKSVAASPTPPLTINVDALLRTMVREALTGQYSPQAAMEKAVKPWQNDLDMFWNTVSM